MSLLDKPAWLRRSFLRFYVSIRIFFRKRLIFSQDFMIRGFWPLEHDVSRFVRICPKRNAQNRQDYE